MKKILLLLVVVLLSNFKTFSQTATATDDSLVCFPQRYLEMIKQDLIKGDNSEKKAQELQKVIITKESENLSLKKEIRSQIESCSSCRDTIQMRDHLIDGLHLGLKRQKRQKTIYIIFTAFLAVLYTVK